MTDPDGLCRALPGLKPEGWSSQPKQTLPLAQQRWPVTACPGRPGAARPGPSARPGPWRRAASAAPGRACGRCSGNRWYRGPRRRSRTAGTSRGRRCPRGPGRSAPCVGRCRCRRRRRRGPGARRGGPGRTRSRRLPRR
ncbi:hypothetical protein B9W64_37755 [Streptomyces sp. CS159]|nr:hypothetical protein B9W64_37755 [Streptomyces sp. CS159]